MDYLGDGLWIILGDGLWISLGDGLYVPIFKMRDIS